MYLEASGEGATIAAALWPGIIAVIGTLAGAGVGLIGSMLIERARTKREWETRKWDQRVTAYLPAFRFLTDLLMLGEEVARQAREIEALEAESSKVRDRAHLEEMHARLATQRAAQKRSDSLRETVNAETTAALTPLLLFGPPDVTEAAIALTGVLRTKGIGDEAAAASQQLLTRMQAVLGVRD